MRSNSWKRSKDKKTEYSDNYNNRKEQIKNRNNLKKYIDKKAVIWYFIYNK